MRRSLPVLAVLAAALSVAACTGSNNSSSGSASATSGPSATTSTTGSAASGDPAVAWVDKFCGEIVRLTDSQTAVPPDLSNSDTGQALKAFDRYISQYIDQVAQAISNLKNAGPAPIAGGDEALTNLVSGLESLKKGYEQAKANFSSINQNDPQAAQAAMVQAFAALSQGGEQFGKAVSSLGSSKELEAASRKAPNCQKLNNSVTATTTTTR